MGRPSKSDRTDPLKNKSLAIRNVLKKLPQAKAAAVAATVKKDYGHEVNKNMVYMIKTKLNMAADGRKKSTKSTAGNGTRLTSALLWVNAIKLARQLLESTGSVANAVALIRAVGQ